MNPLRMIERIIGWRAEPVVSVGIDVPLRRIRRGLLALIVVLVPVNLFVGWLKWLDYENDEQPLAFFRFFDLGEEQNFPAWIATLLLAGSALSAMAAAQRADDPIVRRGFRTSALALAYVSLDEASYLHERLSEPLRDLLGVGGALYWAWVIPAVILVGLLAVRLWPFMQRLPSDVRNDLFLCAALFVGCSVGIEMLDGLAFSVNEEANVVTEVLTIIEEVGEMLAVMLSIDTMLRYASTQTGTRNGSTPSLRGEELRDER